MGFFRDLLHGSKPERPPPPIRVNDGPNTREDWTITKAWLDWGAPCNAIVGEDQYQPAIKAVAKRPRGGKVLRLVNVTLTPEPENPHDSLAICAHVGEHHVGYLRAGVAHLLSEAWGTGAQSVTLAGVARGGGNGRSIGVHIWPQQRVSGGMVLPSCDEWAVSWPPGEWEIHPRDEGGCWEAP